MLEKALNQKDHPVSWVKDQDYRTLFNSLLPLFPVNSKSVGIIRKCRRVVREAVQLLNPRQVQLEALDQPYLICKTYATRSL